MDAAAAAMVANLVTPIVAEVLRLFARDGDTAARVAVQRMKDALVHAPITNAVDERIAAISRVSSVERREILDALASPRLTTSQKQAIANALGIKVPVRK